MNGTWVVGVLMFALRCVLSKLLSACTTEKLSKGERTTS